MRVTLLQGHTTVRHETAPLFYRRVLFATKRQLDGALVIEADYWQLGATNAAGSDGLVVQYPRSLKPFGVHTYPVLPRHRGEPME
jgi:hypothetical protein